MNEPKSQPILPTDAAENEPTDANPVPLSPTDPKHRTDASGMNANTLAEPAVIMPVPLAGTGSGTSTGGATPIAPIVPLTVGNEAADEKRRERDTDE